MAMKAAIPRCWLNGHGDITKLKSIVVEEGGGADVIAVEVIRS